MSDGRRLKVRILRGEPVVGLLLAYDAPWLIEVAALSGCDYIVVDLEHEAIPDQSVVHLDRAATASGIPLLVRTPLGPRVTPLLSIGVAGVWVPHLRGLDHARDIVEQTRFRPLGRRTYYTQTRGATYGIGIDESTWTKQANEELLVVAMLEDAAVIREIEQLLSVEGIDAFHVGTLDLAESMSQPSKEALESVVDAATSACRAASKALGVGVVTPWNLDSIPRRRQQGVQLFTVASAWMLTSAVSAFFGQVRSGIEVSDGG